MPPPPSAHIATLTWNPALDVSTAVDRLEPWRKLRCEQETIEAGGGGVNVARAVRALGGTATAVVALGIAARPFVEDDLQRAAVELRVVPINGRTREDWSVIDHHTGAQYRFVQPGPQLSTSEWQSCVQESLIAASGAACFVISGSLPDSVPPIALQSLATRLAAERMPVIVDTSGPGLAAALSAPVALVKPSVDELVAAAGRPLPDVTTRAQAAGQLLRAGACAALVVSMGADGALLVQRDEPAWLIEAPPVEQVSSSGAGDSMVAAMALSLAAGLPLIDVVRYGVAAGAAAVLAPGTALCHLDKVLALVPLVRVHRLASIERNGRVDS
jgi:6-phosphofructokinase 2